MGANDAKANKNTNPRYILAGMLKGNVRQMCANVTSTWSFFQLSVRICFGPLVSFFHCWMVSECAPRICCCLAAARRGKMVNRDQKDQLSPPPRNVPCTPSNVIHSQSKWNTKKEISCRNLRGKIWPFGWLLAWGKKGKGDSSVFFSRESSSLSTTPTSDDFTGEAGAAAT